MSKWISIFLITTIVLAWEIEGRCYTAWGAPGQCVNIKLCDPLMRLLRPRPISPPVVRVLRKSQCGFEGFDPKVCCQKNDESPNHDQVPTKSIPYEKFNKIETTTKTPARTTTTRRTIKTPAPFVSIHDHPNRHLLDDEQCGPLFEGRIYGGNVTAIYEFPWMAVLGYDPGDGTNEFRCGGSLISERYVLTAAHCTTQLPDDLELKMVRLGDYDLTREIDCDAWENGVGYNCAEKYQDFGIERVHVHPDFTRRKLWNDISLIRLSGPANFGPPSVRPICLPIGHAALLKSNKATVTGWGATKHGIRSPRLLKVKVPIVGTDECNRAYRYQMIKIWHKQICAGGVLDQDSCAGDSGGPLQGVGTYNGQPRSVLYGIVSFGPHSCGVKGHPGVYTNVASYLAWILDSMTE